MKFFSKTTPAPVSPIVECRSWYGVSYHLRDTRVSTGVALCGYEPLDDRLPVTKEEILTLLGHQHEGFKYCGTCVKVFLATP